MNQEYYITIFLILQTESLITATQNNSATNEFLEQVKLNSTNSKIENRSEVYMNISDGFALINDALNLNYCRPKDEYYSTISFKDSFNIAVGPSNNISQSNLVALFNQIAQKAGEHFYGVQDPTKATFMFDVRQADNISNNNMPIYVYFMMTKGSCNSPVNYPYGANEGWGYGNNTGRCDYTDPGFDAADIFRCDLRKNLCYKNKQTAYYYTDRYSVCFGMFNDFCQSFDINYLNSDDFVSQENLLNPTDPLPEDNHFDHLLFGQRQKYPNYHLCLDSEELNFFYNSSANLVGSYKPDSKKIGNIEYGCDFKQSEMGSSFHTMRTDYFKVNLILGTLNQQQLPCFGCNP